MNLRALLFFLLIICSFLFSSIFSGLYAQYTHNREEFIPSIQNWSFMKYGSAEQNLHTGTVSHKIPLYSYQDVDFEIPISLNYASNGYTPGVQASQVGLGWYLNAGGFITREVRDLPDDLIESNSSYQYYDNEFREGFYSYHIANTTTSDDPFERGRLHLPLAYKTFGMPRDWSQALFSYFYTDLNGNEVMSETDPDIFTFNFLGFRGKFMLGPNNKIYIFDTSSPHGEFKIEFSEFQKKNLLNDTSKIIITTADGYVYTFGGSKSFEYLDHSHHAQYDIYHIYDLNRMMRNYSYHQITWPLTKIMAPNGRSVIFEYESAVSGLKKYGGILYEVLPFAFIPDSYEMYEAGPIWGEGKNGSYRHTTTTAYLKSINIDNKTSINFIYGNRVKEKSKFGNDPVEEEQTLPRLENILIQNYIDKENTTTNSNILRSIILDYIYGSTQGNPVMLLDRVKISGEEPYCFEYYDGREKSSDTPLLFPYLGTSGIDHWGYFNNKHDYPYNNYGSISSEDPLIEYHNPNFYGTILGMLKKITYPTKGYSEFQYEFNTYKHSAGNSISNQFYPEVIMQTSEKQSGGLRLKKTIDYASDGNIKTKRYTYEDGRLLYMPLYFFSQQYKVGGYAGQQYIHARFSEPVTLNDHYFIPLGADSAVERRINIYAYSVRRGKMLYGNNPFSFSHNIYDQVREFNEDNSHTLYVYTFQSLQEEALAIRKNKFYNGTPRDYIDWENYEGGSQYKFWVQPTDLSIFIGKLKQKILYNNENKPVYSLTNKYNHLWDKPLKKYTTVHHANNIAYNHHTYIESLPLLGTTEVYYYDNKILQKDISYQYNGEGQINMMETIDQEGDRQIIEYQYPQEVPISKQKGGESIMKERNAIKYPIRIKNSILKKNQSVPLMIQGQLLDYTRKTSDGENSRLSFGIKKIFSSLLNTPTQYSGFEFDDVLDFNTPKISYEYNKDGRVKAILKNTNCNIFYIWAYGGRYPIIEIENTNESLIKAAVRDVFGLNNIDDVLNLNENDITLSKLNQFRTLVYLNNARISTYTYQPLVGVLTKTDPSGKTIYYEYDEFGRLKRSYLKVKNSENNNLEQTLQFYDYHFRNQ